MKIVLQYIFTICLFLLIGKFSTAQSNELLNPLQIQAIQYLDSVGSINQSVYWHNANPKLLIQNIRKNILQPTLIYAGSNTNFCGYAAITYSFILEDPLRYTQFMIALYQNGKASCRKIHFMPSDAVKEAAGLLKFKGALDINHADQIWFMSLADYFKGYVNIFNLHYKMGAENTLWPATNFAKFNSMLRKICNYKVEAIGSDLIRPIISDIISFLNNKLRENYQVFLFLNNAILHKSNHNKVTYRLPTHYVVLFNIVENDGVINLTYWDYGCNTLRQLPTKVFNDILFGITWCNKKGVE